MLYWKKKNTHRNDPSPPRAVAAETGNATAGRRRVVDVNDYDHLPRQGMPSAAAVHANIDTNTDDYDQAPPAATSAASSTKGSKGKASNDVISSDDEDDDDDDDDYDYDDDQDADGRRTSSTPRRKSKKSAAGTLLHMCVL